MQYILLVSVIINILLITKILILRISIKNLRIDYEERAGLRSNTLLRVTGRDHEMRKLVISMNKTLEKLRDLFQQYEQGDQEFKTDRKSVV